MSPRSLGPLQRQWHHLRFLHSWGSVETFVSITPLCPLTPPCGSPLIEHQSGEKERMMVSWNPQEKSNHSEVCQWQCHFTTQQNYICTMWRLLHLVLRVLRALRLCECDPRKGDITQANTITRANTITHPFLFLTPSLTVSRLDFIMFHLVLMKIKKRVILSDSLQS